MNTSPKFFNLDQCDFLIREGCTAYRTGIEWSEKLNKDAVYRIFIDNDEYKSAMKIWRERTR